MGLCFYLGSYLAMSAGKTELSTWTSLRHRPMLSCRTDETRCRQRFCAFNDVTYGPHVEEGALAGRLDLHISFRAISINRRIRD